MPVTGEESSVVQKAVADPLDSPPITSIDPTQEWTGSEFVSRDMDPELLVHPLTTDCHVS